tara:strand:+ start:3596 stop:4105 length:510 start_codon:yes stop_codon:yes gene_type:complete
MVKLKMMKRIYKELNILENYYGKEKIEVRTLFENEQDPYVINVYKNKHLFCNIKIILPYNYPFKEPMFCLYSVNSDKKISIINYFDFFKKCSQFYFYENNVMLQEHSCPCCFNKICNRQLNETLLELSKDVQKFGIQFMRLREKYFLKNYIKILNYLNEDVLNIILSYI